jgi:uncharacterized protein (UPF0218 family)
MKAPSMQRYILTEELRQKLKDPLGLLVEGKKNETMDKLKSIIDGKRPKRVISVGDIVSRNASQFSIPVDVNIIDNIVMREKIEDFEFRTKRTFQINNPAGTIELLAWQAIKEAIKVGDSTVLVNGEEDLLTLVSIIEAPLKSIVFYGQPNKGIVIVEVGEEKKKEAKEIINSMTIK